MIHLWTSPEINTPEFYHYDLIRQLGNVLVTKPRIDHKSGGSGVHVIVVLARWLFLNHDWLRSLDGPKIIVEHDAYLNFLPESEYHGCWTRLYQTCNFDLLISSGKYTAEMLRNDGLPTVWVPKGANAEFLNVENRGNKVMGYFAAPIAEQETGRKFYFYKSRYNMGEWLNQVVEPIACPFDEFASIVAGYRGVITNDATMREPMAKQFECSALGCAVIRDRQPELYDLGFVEGESVLSYDTFPEMMDLVDRYSTSKGIADLEQIGKAAREVARKHTWTHRAHQIAGWVRPYIKTRVFL